MSAPSTQLSSPRSRRTGLPRSRAQPLGKLLAAFRAPRMDADLVEIERDGRAAARSNRQCRARRYGRALANSLRARYLAPIAVTAPVRMSVIAAGIEHRARHAGARIEQQQQRRSPTESQLVIVDEVADDLDAREIDRRLRSQPRSTLKWPCSLATRASRCTRGSITVSPRPWAREAGLDRREDLVVGELELLDVEAVQIGDVDRLHSGPSMGSCKPCSRAHVDRQLVAGIGMAHDARRGIVGQDALQPARRRLGAVGDDDHAGVLRITDPDAAAIVDRNPGRTGGAVEKGVQQRPVGNRVRAVAHRLGLAVRARHRAGVEVIAADDDRRLEFARRHHLVEGKPRRSPARRGRASRCAPAIPGNGFSPAPCRARRGAARPRERAP